MMGGALEAPESIEDLMENPAKWGMPTFDEFRKNKEKWTGRPDDEIVAIDRGDPLLGCRQQYYVQDTVGRYRVESLEHAERIAVDMGLSLFHDFVTNPQLRPDGAGSYYNEVTFLSKRSIEKRAHW